MVILYDTLEGIVGKHMVLHVFSLLATLFIFILTRQLVRPAAPVSARSVGATSVVRPANIAHVDVPILASDHGGPER